LYAYRIVMVFPCCKLLLHI